MCERFAQRRETVNDQSSGSPRENVIKLEDSHVPPRRGWTMTEPEVIKLEALERLQKWGGDKLVGQMVRLFLKNSGARMEQIRSGVSSGDVEEAEYGAHSLKSSAANVGAETLRQLATQIETAAVERDVDRMREVLPDMEVAYASAMSELEKLEQGMSDEP